jgi:hypothetical protein
MVYFQTQHPNLGKFFIVLAMKVVGKFYGQSVSFMYLHTAFSYISWSFCILCGRFGIFLPFWYVLPRKIWQPCSRLPCQCDNHLKLSLIVLRETNELA